MPRSAPASRQRGQSLIDYTLMCAVLAFVLFVPIADQVSGNAAKTTAELILDGFRSAYQRFSYAISLPG